jgi:hypothetical protein
MIGRRAMVKPCARETYRNVGTGGYKRVCPPFRGVPERSGGGGVCGGKAALDRDTREIPNRRYTPLLRTRVRSCLPSKGDIREAGSSKDEG